MLGIENYSGQQNPAANTLHNTSNTTNTLPYLSQYPAPYKKKHDETPYNPWPDGWGHTPEPIGNETLRIFLKNLNGIRPWATQQCTKLDTGLPEFSDLTAGILLLNEHNTDTKKPEVREGYRRRLLKHWPHNRTEYSTSTIKATNDYLPGGTLISVFNHWTGRILNSEVDPTKMGRWSCMNLRGKEENIISVYRVPQDSLPGPFTAYAQQ